MELYKSYLKKVLNIPRRIYRFIERIINQRHCYDYPFQNNGWNKHGNRPVVGNKITGSIFDPYVLEYNNQFLMFASHRKDGTIVKFDSSDGVLWKDMKISLCGISGTWEEAVNRCCVIFHDGKWKMWYTGQNKGISSIGYSESVDGICFKRIGTTPVLFATLKHECISVMNPCVIWNEEKNLFQMWYSAGEDYEPDVICYAESIDGISWNKWNNPVLCAERSREWEKYKVGGCSVLKDKIGNYKIYYIGYQNLDVARICEAVSENGINWNRSKNNLLLGPTRNSWDADATYKPSVLQRDRKQYMWYNGRNGYEEYIGLATRNINENEI